MEEAESSLEAQASTNLVRRSKRSQRTPESAHKSSKKKKKKTMIVNEIDGIGIPGSDISLATHIKREAFKIFNKNIKNLNNLSQRKRKIMCAGLSSILDLSDQSFHSQRDIFTKEQWDHINRYFDDALKIELVMLKEDIKDTLVVTENVLNLSGDYKAAKRYVNAKEDACDYNTTCSISYQMMTCILNLMQRYQYLFQMPQTANIRENDFLRLVWSPLFEILFPPEGNIRLVTGESMNHLSTQYKAEQYPDNNHIHGSKVDMRLVVIIGNEEIDLAVGECAKANSDKKAIGDPGKLLREAKEAIDGLVPLIDIPGYSYKAYSVQCTGISCLINSTHFVASDLYVTKIEHSFNLPSNMSNWKTLHDIIPQLLTFKHELAGIANDVISKFRDRSTPDIYGYIKINDNNYYNVYTKKNVEKHPMYE